jgi:alkanesulfonate monooxygenase SsuD/methylene tetrahydromethanopterin reductase-like flavin-dependent oxidoreductase (luciferase family)
VSGPRTAVALPGAEAATLVAAAQAAEASNLDCIMIGDVGGTAPNSDDTYVLTAAAAVATATTDLRISLALDLRGSAPPLRVAEDLGVLDVMSAGRTELLLTPGADPGWRPDLDAVLGAWMAWPVADGATAPVTPAPVQPVIPAWLVEGASATGLHGAQGVVFVDWPGEIPGLAALEEMRRVRDEAGAATVVVDAGAVSPDRHTEVIRALGTVVAPCLRCPADEVAILALDSTEYLLERTDLHEPPIA